MKLRCTNRDLLWLRAMLGMAWGGALDHVRHASIEWENVTQRKHIELLGKSLGDLQRLNQSSAEAFNERFPVEPPGGPDP
jgi:hypothetical protein